MTLRRYIRQLHCVEATPLTPPGPVSKEGPRKCVHITSIFGPVGPSRGPFASYKELTAFMEQRYCFYFRHKPEAKGRGERFDDSSPLVLTHNDLNPRNIVVGDDGQLWVLDWAWSGFYPGWFELYTMSNQVSNEEVGGWYDWFWDLMVPFVCGPYFRQQLWLSKAAYGFAFR